MNTKRFTSLVVQATLVSGLATAVPLDAHAQFKKYKSKTTFNAGSAQNAAATVNNKQVVPPPPQGIDAADTLGSAAGATIDDESDADIEVVGSPTLDSASDANPPSIKVLAKKAKSISRPVGADDDEEEGNADIFGRGTGINSVKKTEAQKKYVTLNPETAFGPEVITSFDFPNVSLQDLTKHMQSLTGINLILDKELKGSISIMAPTPITVGDAWKAYLSALNINGYAIVKSGAFYKIVNARIRFVFEFSFKLSSPLIPFIKRLNSISVIDSFIRFIAGRLFFLVFLLIFYPLYFSFVLSNLFITIKHIFLYQ